MKLYEKIIHSFLLSFLFTVLTWIVVNKLILEMSFIRYLIIEFILIISLKLFNFTKLKLKLN